MALWVCKEDGTKYAVDAPRCPECGSTDHYEDGAAPPAEPPPVVDNEGEKKPATRASARGAK